MPETKHTPGPWLAEGTIQATDPERIVGPVLYVFASGVGGECIAHTSSEANARLIAAAPELLEALHGTLDHPWDACTMRNAESEKYPPRCKGCAAIAKAEGR